MVSRGIKCVRHEQRVGGMRGMRGTRGESQQQARAGLPPTRHVEVSIRRGFCKSVQQKTRSTRVGEVYGGAGEFPTNTVRTNQTAARRHVTAGRGKDVVTSY